MKTFRIHRSDGQVLRKQLGTTPSSVGTLPRAGILALDQLRIRLPLKGPIILFIGP